jgi:hypothetical protein
LFANHCSFVWSSLGAVTWSWLHFTSLHRVSELQIWGSVPFPPPELSTGQHYLLGLQPRSLRSSGGARNSRKRPSSAITVGMPDTSSGTITFQSFPAPSLAGSWGLRKGLSPSCRRSSNHHKRSRR